MLKWLVSVLSLVRQMLAIVPTVVLLPSLVGGLPPGKL